MLVTILIGVAKGEMGRRATELNKVNEATKYLVEKSRDEVSSLHKSVMRVERGYLKRGISLNWGCKDRQQVERLGLGDSLIQ